MAIVINISDKNIFCSEVQKAKKKWYVKKAGEITGYTVSPNELLNDSIFLKNFLVENFGRRKNEKFYVTINGFDIAYRTANYADYIIEDENADLSSEEKELALLELCKKNIPDGCLELHKNYEVCIISAAKIEALNRYVICAGYIPTRYLENIKFAFEEAGLSLYGIYPEVYGLYNAFQQNENNLYLETENLTVICNAACLIVWPHSNDHKSDDEVKEFLISEINDLIPEFINNTVIQENFETLIREEIKAENPTIEEASALGVLNKSHGLYIIKADKIEAEGDDSSAERNKLWEFLQEIRNRFN